VAESIGSTLGAIAAKADAAADAAKEVFSGSESGQHGKTRKQKTCAQEQARQWQTQEIEPVRAARRTIRKATKRAAGRRKRAKK